MSDSTEYMRRNLLVAKAIGANNNAQAALKRLEGMKRPPKWLIKAVSGIIERTEPLAKDLANYRDLIGESIDNVK